MYLPECRARLPIEALDPRQRAELIRLLAEKGPEALEAWLKAEAQRDPGIRRRLERHRARLERSARAARDRAEGELEERRRRVSSTWEERAADQLRREEELRLRIAQAMGVPVLHLSDVAPSPPSDLRKPSALAAWWRRLRAALVVWWAHVQAALRPSLASRRKLRLGDLELDLERMAHDDPGLLARARTHARKDGLLKRIVAFFRRLFGLEDAYADLRRLLEHEAQEARRRQLILAQQVRVEAEGELDRMKEAAAKDAEARRRELEELEAAQRRVASESQTEPYRALVDDVMGELAESGLVDSKGLPTERLLSRFSAMLFEETRVAAEAGPVAPGRYMGGEGEYERGAMASVHELGAMELVDTVLRARTRHPKVRHIQDDDVIVHREARSSRAHVVVIFDHSNSMEANERLEAAKRVCLVLHRALREDDPDHRIDLVAMGTGVRRVDLATCWAAQPHGFTNQGAALREARRLLDTSDADRRLVYMITDGLPEARTLPDGRDVADRVDACLPDALAAAKQLRDMSGVRVLILQLETKDPKYLEAAGKVAKAAGGRVVGLDPKELAKTLLVDLRMATRPVAAV